MPVPIEMTDKCFNCRRDEQQVPLLAWRYQGREHRVCSDCLPLLIHKREQVLKALEQRDDEQ